MNYEKKYNEALNWMREFYPGLHGATKEDAEHYFPELAESEDERIRKAIVLGIKRCADAGSIFGTVINNEGVNYHDVLAWLEKQKEQKPPVDVDPCDASWDAYYQRGLNKGYELGLEAGRKEQKQELVQHPPITYTYPSDASRDERLKAAILALLNSDLLKVKEGGYFTKQDLIEWVERIPTDKPAEWSKEDERHLIWLCRIIHNRVVNKELSLAEESELGKWIDKWINHKPKPVQKWDDFDEDCLKRAIWYVENPAPSVVKDTNLVLWLKSLRPQPHWKPSEEHLSALLAVFNDPNNIGSQTCQLALSDLYEQLLKLK